MLVVSTTKSPLRSACSAAQLAASAACFIAAVSTSQAAETKTTRQVLWEQPPGVWLAVPESKAVIARWESGMITLFCRPNQVQVGVFSEEKISGFLGFVLVEFYIDSIDPAATDEEGYHYGMLADTDFSDDGDLAPQQELKKISEAMQRDFASGVLINADRTPDFSQFIQQLKSGNNLRIVQMDLRGDITIGQLGLKGSARALAQSGCS